MEISDSFFLKTTVKKFDHDMFLRVHSMKRPSRKMKNLVMVFLTLLQDHLDYLVKDLADEVLPE